MIVKSWFSARSVQIACVKEGLAKKISDLAMPLEAKQEPKLQAVQV